jgi:hypothetical protein
MKSAYFQFNDIFVFTRIIKGQVLGIRQLDIIPHYCFYGLVIIIVVNYVADIGTSHFRLVITTANSKHF